MFVVQGDGARWAIAAPQPSGFGFAVACEPRDLQRAWFVPARADAARVPDNGRVVVTRSDDGGASFQVLSEGLPRRQAYHLVYRHALAVAIDGQTLAALQFASAP